MKNIITLLLSTVLLFSCTDERNDKIREIKKTTHDSVYPGHLNKAAFSGYVKSVKNVKIKRGGDFMFSYTNRVEVQTDSRFVYWVSTDEMTFGLGDTIDVTIVPSDKGLYPTRTFIVKKGSSDTSFTYFSCVNKTMKDELDRYIKSVNDFYDNGTPLGEYLLNDSNSVNNSTIPIHPAFN